MCFVLTRLKVCINECVLTAESVVEEGDVLFVEAGRVSEFALVVVGEAVGAANGQKLGRADWALAMRQPVAHFHALGPVGTNVPAARTRRTCKTNTLNNENILPTIQ